MSSMIAHYPEFVAWHLPLVGVQSADALFSSKTLKKIKRGLRELEAAGYTLAMEPLDQATAEAFEKLYRANLAKKRSPKYVEMHVFLESSKQKKHDLYALALRKEGVLHGALVFFIALDGVRLMTALKVFPAQLEDVKLPISPTYLAEYALFQHGIDLGLQKVVHGKDRNLTGQTSAIGLAMFKLSLGCRPMASMNTQILPLGDLQLAYKEDTLVFLAEERNQPITQAILFSDKPRDELEEQYRVLFQNQHYTLEVRPLTVSS